ncbi:MAG: DUF805 domain-containing protein, partial [Flavobacteriales bacterium]
MNWYLHVLRNYANFSGRARRSEFWFYVLFNMIFGFAAMFIDNGLGTTISIADGLMVLPYGNVYILYTLFVLVPGLAVAVRRLHDIGKSGWMYLIVLIPLVGAIWLLILFCQDSQAGANKWG